MLTVFTGTYVLLSLSRRSPCCWRPYQKWQRSAAKKYVSVQPYGIASCHLPQLIRKLSGDHGANSIFIKMHSAHMDLRLHLIHPEVRRTATLRLSWCHWKLFIQVTHDWPPLDCLRHVCLCCSELMLTIACLRLSDGPVQRKHSRQQLTKAGVRTTSLQPAGELLCCSATRDPV